MNFRTDSTSILSSSSVGKILELKMALERHQSRTSRGISQMSPPDESTFSKVQKIFITESNLNHSEDNSIHNFHSTSF